MNKRNLICFSVFLMTLVLGLDNSFSQDEFPKAHTVSDADNNIYIIDTIGTQIWMLENLKTTRYNDSTFIPLVTTIEEWIYLSTPGYSWYRGDYSLKNEYGALYNWPTVNTGKLCPVGWHVPSDFEWNTLVKFCGGEAKAGAKIKEDSTAHWVEPNDGATNESGFTALPGGDRSANGSFSGLGFYGTWWSSTENGAYNAWYRLIYSSSNSVYRNDEIKRSGFSVRCLKD